MKAKVQTKQTGTLVTDLRIKASLEKVASKLMRGGVAPRPETRRRNK